jgi:hypothetical protein
MLQLFLRGIVAELVVFLVFGRSPTIVLPRKVASVDLLSTHATLRS